MEHSKESRALLSAAQAIAISEGISDEEVMVSRINEIYHDAVLEEPKSEAGVLARTKAIEILQASEAVVSPYGENKFNYDEYQDSTILPAIVGIFKLFPAYIDDMVNIAKVSQPSEKEVEARFEAVHNLSIESFKVLNEFKVPMSKYGHLFSKMKEMIAFLEQVQEQQMIGHRNEVLSRAFLTPNPGHGQYDATYATYADLLEARLRLKKETDGPDGEDRFTLKKNTPTEDFE